MVVITVRSIVTVLPRLVAARIQIMIKTMINNPPNTAPIAMGMVLSNVSVL